MQKVTDSSRKIIIDTDVGWSYADDGFAISIAIKKMRANDISIELINSTCGSNATAQYPSSVELVERLLSENGIRKTLVCSENAKALREKFLLPDVHTYVALGPFYTLAEAVNDLDDSYFKEKDLYFQGDIPSYNIHQLSNNQVWFHAFQRVIQRPWRRILFFPWRTTELQTKYLLSDYTQGTSGWKDSNGQYDGNVPALGKTFGQFCDHFLTVKDRYLDDTLVVYYLLFPSLVTAKYFEVIPVSGYYPNGNDKAYQIKFHDSTKVLKMNLETKRTREYIEEIKRYLFEPIL